MEHEERGEELEREADKLEEHSESVGQHIDDARRQSDQLPEEGPAEQVHDDTGGGVAHDPPGVPGEEQTATGNPRAAGADEEGDDPDEEDSAGA